MNPSWCGCDGVDALTFNDASSGAFLQSNNTSGLTLEQAKLIWENNYTWKTSTSEEMSGVVYHSQDNSRIDSLNKEIEELKKKNKELEADNTELIDSNIELQEEIDALKAKLKELKK